MQIKEMLAEQLESYIKDDKVRPNITAEFRCCSGLGRRSYSLVDGNDIKAIVCVANGYFIPKNEDELEQIAYGKNNKEYFMIPYTIWSYAPGAGRTLIVGLIGNIRKEIRRTGQKKPRVVTMSPKTVMARRFHTKNGAILIQENEESYNFEYTI